VRIAARHRELQLAMLDAVEKWKETGDFDDLCEVTAAQRAVVEYEAKLARLAELRRSLAELRAAAKVRQSDAQPREPEEPSGEVTSPTDALYGRAHTPDLGTTGRSPFA